MTEALSFSLSQPLGILAICMANVRPIFLFATVPD
jgi:hypothetical protein